MKRNVSGDFPGSKDDLLVVAALNPLLHKFEHFEYFSDFISFEDLLEFFSFSFLLRHVVFTSMLCFV